MKKKILMVMSVCALMNTAGCKSETMEIKNDKVIIEYGLSISSDASTYLNNSAEFCKDVLITGIPQNEKNKSYPSVGKYEIKLQHKKSEIPISIEIRDTVAPVFKNVKESYTIEYGKSFNEEIQAYDLSNVTITVDDSKVNYKKAGEYKSTVKAIDVHGNETEKDFAINIKEEEKESASLSSSSSTGKENSSKPTSNNSSSSKTETGKNETTSSANKKPSSKPTSNKTETSLNSDEKPASSSDKNISEENSQSNVSKPEIHVHIGQAVENMYFDSCDELDEWAWNYQVNVLGHGGAYGVSDCSCGKVYINMFY